MQLLHNVNTADKLAPAVKLGVGGPLAPRLEALSHLRVAQNVKMSKTRDTRANVAIQKFDDSLTEAALRHVRVPLHEKHNWLAGDQLLKAFV